MKLIDPSLVLDYLGKDTSPDNLASVSSAILMATASLEARLDTTFSEGSKVDTFLSTGSLLVGQTYMTRMRASNGFIKSTGLTLTTSTAVSLFGTSDAVSRPDLVIDFNKGIVTETTSDLTGLFLRLTYSYGFTDIAGLYQNVPEWLQQACKLMAITSLIAAPNPLVTEPGAGKSEYSPKALISQFETIMSQHVRYAPSSALPI